MRRLALFLLPAALVAGEARYARLGEIEGRPEIQLRAADAWQPALRNTPLIDGAWVRTGASARAEIELDEGSAWRLDAESLGELSDYTQLSTGQRITLLSLDRGVAYFTGAPEGRDALILAVPGAQATVRRGARLRLEARDAWSQIAVIEGSVLFSSPAAELEIKEGQMVRAEPGNAARFFLYREIPALESDKWSEARDKALVTSSGGHLAGARYGVADLDAAGTWIETGAFGTVWKPKIAAGWAPFRNGKWAWYEGLGYTWIAAEPWGWLPYHYGRWAQDQTAGWVWVPGKDTVFSPGDVFWLRGAKLAGWGPLAPGEVWDGRARPQLFLNANSTFAAFVPEMREIDPAGFAAPKEPLAVAAFTAALPSPALAAARLEAQRPALRAGSTRVVPHLAGVTFEQAADGVGAGTAGAQPAPGYENAAQVVNTTIVQPPPEPPLVIVTPPEPPPETYYPAPVFTGIVVVNPPERDRDDSRRRRREQPQPAPLRPAPKPREEQPKAAPAPPAPQPAPAAAPIRRTEEVQKRPDPPKEQPKPVDAPAAPVPRTSDAVTRGEAESRRKQQ